MASFREVTVAGMAKHTPTIVYTVCILQWNIHVQRRGNDEAL